MPFTEQYARESVPEQYWSSPRFKNVNRQLTLVWAVRVHALRARATSSPAYVNTQRSNTIFNWVIPIFLVVLAIKRTAAVSEEAGK